MLFILIYEEALKDLIKRKEANNFNHLLRFRYFYVHTFVDFLQNNNPLFPAVKMGNFLARGGFFWMGKDPEPILKRCF